MTAWSGSGIQQSSASRSALPRRLVLPVSQRHVLDYLRKAFFSEEKKQKTFIYGATHR
jgi:hypothetical protein